MLTPRQLEVFDFISCFISEHRRSPSLREIAAGIGRSTHVNAFNHVERLCRQGYLQKKPHEKYAIRILKYPAGATSPTTGATITQTSHDAELRAAYARGVQEGRRQTAHLSSIARGILSQ